MARTSLAAAAAAFSIVARLACADAALLDSGNVRWSIDPATLALSAVSPDGSTVAFSDGLESPLDHSGIEAAPTSAAWRVPSKSMDVRVRTVDGDGLEIAFVVDSPQVFEWPSASLAATSELAWPRGEGNLVPISEEPWRELLLGEEWNTLESLSMPFWGVRDGDATATWLVSTQFRNSIKFSPGDDGGLGMRFAHDFNVKSPERAIAFRVHLDGGDNPVVPAQRYRSWLQERNRIVPMREKLRQVPKAERLLGAPHVYVWGHDPVTRFDVLRPRWMAFCERLVDDSGSEGSVARALRGRFDDEQWKAVVEVAGGGWPHDFAKNQIAAGLSAALRAGALAPAAGAEEPLARRIERNGKALVAAFPDDFLPMREWGNGSSSKMLRALHDAGIERIKLCTDSWEGFEMRPWVAEEADRSGWLAGTYDSYHSIHDPKLAGTDATWTTAQMAPDLWESAGIVRADGSYIKGFKGTGRRLNPVAGEAFAHARMNSNFAAVPFNYYFLDCDAFGELVDDFSPVHPMSMEEDAAARSARLAWIARMHGAVVGSEGGSEYAINSVHVVEGVFGPHFGWDDADMRDEDSEYYRGRYYPADAPDVNFRPIPLKSRFVALQYDPRRRIPLFETVFHDAVVATHHWANAHFKHPQVRATTELTEILYLCPPMYHLNIDEFAKRRDAVMEHVRVWSPLHRAHGFAAMTAFRHLSEDRSVQETAFGDALRIIVNFGNEAWSGEGVDVPAGSALVMEDGKEAVLYAPAGDAPR